MGTARNVFRVADNVRFKAAFRSPGGAALDITGGAVKFIFKIGTAPAEERDATITDAAAGLAEYLTAGADFAAAGDVEWEWRVTLAGNVAHGPPTRRRGVIVEPLT